MLDAYIPVPPDFAPEFAEFEVQTDPALQLACMVRVQDKLRGYVGEMRLLIDGIIEARRADPTAVPANALSQCRANLADTERTLHNIEQTVRAARADLILAAHPPMLNPPT